MIKLIPLLAAALLIYIGLRHYRGLAKGKKKSFLIKIAVYLVIILLVLGFVTGRVPWIGAIAAGLLGLLKFGIGNVVRFMPFLKFLSNSALFGDPVFKTPTLKLTLNLKTGLLSGEVTKGIFAGKQLSELTNKELDTLAEHVQETDKRAYYLLKVYMQKQASSSQDTSFGNPNVADPDIEESRLILGLPETFTQKDIDFSYKRLMQKIHPDRGGNDYLASRVNRARDLLTEHLNKKS